MVANRTGFFQIDSQSQAGLIARPITRSRLESVAVSIQERVLPCADEVKSNLSGPDVTNDHRLRKHADYQRVYREGRKQFSTSMSYFFAVRPENADLASGPRVGLTAGKVVGKAVERNRIKRRMREIVRRRVAIVEANIDIVLHPKRSVLTADFAKLESEVARIFTIVQASIDKQSRTRVAPPRAGA